LGFVACENGSSFPAKRCKTKIRNYKAVP
jgi:hypothetical protein